MKTHARNRASAAFWLPAMAAWLLLLLSAPRMVAQVSIVLPEGAANSWGNASLSLGTAYRFQEVINPEALVAKMPNGAWIIGLSFRHAGPPGIENFSLVHVRLSSTTARADGLSQALSQNPGSDQALVFSSTSVQWDFTSSTRSFDAVIPLTTPFLYLPNKGSLLIDVTLAGASLNTLLDAHEQVADGMSMAFQQGDPSGPVSLQPWAPVVRIQYTALPAAPHLEVVAQSSEEIRQNGFRLSLAGATNTKWLVESSGDLQNWQPLSTNVLTSSPQELLDSTATNAALRYYRARWLWP